MSNLTCPKCGNNVREGSIFCNHCGVRLSNFLSITEDNSNTQPVELENDSIVNSCTCDEKTEPIPKFINRERNEIHAKQKKMIMISSIASLVIIAIVLVCVLAPLGAFFGGYDIEVIDNEYIIIKAYHGSRANLKIPSHFMVLGKKCPVTYIDRGAFRNNTYLASVQIPNSITGIGNSAFAYCVNLKNVSIPNSVTSIGSHAFASCTSLTSITIPDSVTIIDKGTFWNCNSLISISLPDSITAIAEFAFRDCTNLDNITIPDSVTKIGMYSFYHCTSLTKIVLPNNVRIGSFAFSDCPLLTIYYR